MIHRKASAEVRLWYPAFSILQCFIKSRYRSVRVINDVIWCHSEFSRLEAPTFSVTESKSNRDSGRSASWPISFPGYDLIKGVGRNVERPKRLLRLDQGTLPIHTALDFSTKRWLF
jgi:hypothetical protein